MVGIKINGREINQNDKNTIKAANKATFGILGVIVFTMFFFGLSTILGIGAFFIGMHWLKPTLQQLAKAQKEAAEHLRKRRDLPDEQQSGDPYVDFEQEYEEENVETILESIEAQKDAKRVASQTTTEVVVSRGRAVHIGIAIALIGGGFAAKNMGFEHWLFIVIVGAAWFLFRGINK